VNLEVDVVAKYVERLTAGYVGIPSAHEEAGSR
jgi:riboflavin synthase